MIEILHADINSSKLTILTQSMELTTAEAKKFWPLQKEYAKQVDALRNKRLAIIRNYADNYTTMSEAKASELALESFAIQRQLQQLKCLDRLRGYRTKKVLQS